MSTNGRRDADDATTEDRAQSREELRTQLELLAEENQQLRESYTRAKQTQYRRTALGLGTVGVIAVIGALLLPSARTVLFALGGTGLFGGVLTYYLTPEQFVSADVGRDVYTALADNEAALATELGLSDDRVYVPTGTADGVRLFLPQHDSYTLPDEEALEHTLVVTDETTARGVAVDPSGGRLFRSFEAALTGSLAATPQGLADQLTDALVDQFELVRTASPELDPDGQRLTVAISGSVYGPVDRFDHPIASLLATGLATGLEKPVSLNVKAATGDRADYLVTYRWGETEASGTTSEASR